MDYCPKNYQNTLIFIIFARKINKISEFYMIFAGKMPELGKKMYTVSHKKRDTFIFVITLANIGQFYYSFTIAFSDEL